VYMRQSICCIYSSFTTALEAHLVLTNRFGLWSEQAPSNAIVLAVSSQAPHGASGSGGSISGFSWCDFGLGLPEYGFGLGGATTYTLHGKRSKGVRCGAREWRGSGMWTWYRGPHRIDDAGSVFVLVLIVSVMMTLGTRYMAQACP